MHKKILTIICPVYNEEEALPLFFERIHPVLNKLNQHYSAQLLFLNNASTDRTMEQIKAISLMWPETYVITLSKNVSYQASLECGLKHARGDLFVFIDADCEDPPEMILEFVDHHEQGFDIVYGERIDREETLGIKKARKFFYRLLHALADEEIILDMAEFSLFTKEVRKAILQENTSFPFLRASIGRVGFRRFAIPFKRQKRIAGKTKYNLIRMAMFAIAGILSSSTLLLRLPIYFLPIWLFILVTLGIGYASTQALGLAVAAFLFFAGYVGTTVAIVALYVGRTYKNGLNRPNAFIDQTRSRLQPAISELINDLDRIATSTL